MFMPTHTYNYTHTYDCMYRCMHMCVCYTYITVDKLEVVVVVNRILERVNIFGFQSIGAQLLALK